MMWVCNYRNIGSRQMKGKGIAVSYTEIRQLSLREIHGRQVLILRFSYVV